jgi:hypothetical protein
MKASTLSSTRPARGSVLVVAMIMSAVIGISIVSYLNLGKGTMTISNRALYSNAAMNLAENGLEEAMYSLNKKVADATYSWTANDWTPTGSGNINARRRLPSSSGTYNLDQNTKGYVRVCVYNYEGFVAPKMVARSTITLGGATSRTLEKWVYVQLRKTSKFSNGLVAKNSLRFNGNTASVDSWNSDPDHDNDPADAVPYSTSVRDDNGSIGSISVAVGAVGVNNADIWGYAATGAGLPSVGSNGLIGPFGTSSGTMDMSHVSSDFSASFDPVTAPTAGLTAISAIGSSDLPMTLGSTGATNIFSLPSITGNGGATNILTIEGEVTLVLTNTAGSDAIDITGNAGIVITPGSKLIIYTAGDINLGGNGVANGGTTTATANQPANFQIWGTSTTTQTIGVAGNGVLSGVIYAPNADVSINGNGDVMGSVVANNITVTGSAAFHYDESLGDFGGGNPYRVAAWKELTLPSDRATYEPDVNF